MLSFLLGFLAGAIAVAVAVVVYVLNLLGERVPPPHSIDQFPPVEIPQELRNFLRTGEDGQGLSKWETCSSLSLLLHMLFQEHKDSRALRRWMYKRLHVELNDVITRTPAGRFVQDIRILDLSLGTKFPTVKNIRVEKVEMSEDKENFERIHFLVDMDYTGGFETSIGVTMLGREGHLALKVTRLSGIVRLVLSRKPFNHWAFAFISEPRFEFDVTSQVDGHNLRRLIPLITQQIRHTMRRKFVWPNYKIRYRPLFPHPLLQPTPPLAAFAHVKMEGGLEVTVLQCSRLKISAVPADVHYEVYATVTLAHRPFMRSSTSSDTSGHSLTCLLHYSRYDPAAPIGLNFDKNAFNHGMRAVRVTDVQENSLAEKANFRPGDILIAINNVPVRHERQVIRLMGTLGDLMILVERSLEDDEGEMETRNGQRRATMHGEEEAAEVVIRNRIGDGPDAEFVMLGEKGVDREEVNWGELHTMGEKRLSTPERSCSPRPDSRRRHSLSHVATSSLAETEMSSSILEEAADMLRDSSLCSSLHDFPELTDKAVGAAAIVQRTESARVPHVLVSVPSVELRRARSESELNTTMSSASVAAESDTGDAEMDEVMELCMVQSTERAPPIQRQEEIVRFRERPIDVEESDKSALDSLTPAKRSSLEPVSSSASLASSPRQTEDDSGSGGNGQISMNADTSGAMDESRFSRSRNASKRQRLRDTLQAGKRKVFDLAKRRAVATGLSSAMGDDMGVDALLDDQLHLPEGAEGRHSPSPSMGGVCSKRTPPDTDKTKRKRISGGNKSEPITATASTPSPAAPPSPGDIKDRLHATLSTRPVHFASDVIWGQSLHFALGEGAPRVPKYLNVTVHARESQRREGEEPAKPVLLGYTCLYVPQLVDDCQLTSSNAHREVFHLKPPATTPLEAGANINGGAVNASLAEISSHHGFDPRLCFGDVTLRFRYFPQGLPRGGNINANAYAGETDDQTSVDGASGSTGLGMGTGEGREVTPPPSLPLGHQWKAISGRNTSVCASCRGKIWLRSGTCCFRCLVVVHHKCAMKANSTICCAPEPRPEDDELRKELFGEGSREEKEEKKKEIKKGSPTASSEGSIKESPRDDVLSPLNEPGTSYLPLGERAGLVLHYKDTEATSRRAKLRSRMSGVTEKLSSHWRKRRGDKGEGGDGDQDSLAETLPSPSGISIASTTTVSSTEQPSISVAGELADLVPLLEGSPNLDQVHFQPGNAYNEETIANAKRLGRVIFADEEREERKVKINQQIDRIHDAITITKNARKAAMPVRTSTSSCEGAVGGEGVQNGDSSSADFEALEQRLQALAVLMLHYCAALQDCNEDSEADVVSIRSVPERPTSLPESGSPSLSRTSVSSTPSTGVEVTED